MPRSDHSARAWAGHLRPPAGGYEEAGDTLIEVLLALVVISLTAVALLTAFGTSISASAEHKDEATLDSVLKSFVEQATYQLGRQTATSPNFVACATPSTYSNLTIPTVTTAQGTYTASITAVEYWQSNNTWDSPCSTTATPSQQELLTATATSTTGASQRVQFVVSDPRYNPAKPGPPAFSGVFSDTIVAGVPSTFSVRASGAPTPALSSSGQPSWVTLVDDGGGNGTLFMTAPTSAGGNTYTFTISAMNADNGGTTVNQTFTLTVTQAPAITSANNDTVPPATPFSFTVTTTGVPPPALSETGMPSWASFTDNGNGTGTLSASVPVTGSYTFTIGAQNAGGSVSQTFTLVVSAAVAPSFTTAASDTVSINQAFTFPISATGSPSPAITETGALPAGVTFTAGTGSASLSGRPTASGSFPITLTATNVGGTATQSFVLTVNAQSTPTISSPTTNSPVSKKKSKPFSFTLAGTGFQSGATVSFSGGVNNATVTVVFVNSTQLTVAGTTTSNTGPYSFTVTNPDGGAVTSQSGAFVVTS
jgi:type II secretory pathway pseudopilin PulG